MKTDIIMDSIVDDLVRSLDSEIDRINLTLERLDSLRAGLIKKDEQDMKRLLEAIREDQKNTVDIERRRDDISRRLSVAMGCRKQDVNLTKTCSFLQGEKKQIVQEKQRILRQLVGKLKIEHSATYMLLRDCRRFNRMLLKGLLGDVTENVTYNSRGSRSMQMQAGLVSISM